MRYAKIMKYDATNWTGINTTIFFSGCTFHCRGCFNTEIREFSYGELFTDEIMDQFIEHAKSKHITGINILGGEPFQQDLDILRKFILRLKREVGKPIRIWTGYLYEVLRCNRDADMILDLVDTIIDGQFMIELKDIKLKHRGSSNQRIIHMSDTRDIHAL